MRLTRFAVLTGWLLGFAGGGAFAQNSAWKAMEFADLTMPGALSWIAEDVWPDVAARENDYFRKVLKRSLPKGGHSLRVLVTKIQGAGVEYLVSIALSFDCETGANHHGAAAEPSICPLRVARKEQGHWKILVSDRACFVDRQDSSASIANQFDGAEVRYDGQRQAIHLRANVGGTWLATCTRSFDLP
jgi:hypothetical protein